MSITQIHEEVKPQILANRTEDVRVPSDHENPAAKVTLRHPLGIRPQGNALMSQENLQQCMGAFQGLPDVIVLLLLEYLDQECLLNLAGTCRAFFAFTAYDQLWRDIGVDVAYSKQAWRGTWRAMVRQLPSSSLPEVDCQNLFSDALHRPFLCSQIDLGPFRSNIPSTNQIPILRNLSQTDFDKSWTNRPFILTEPVKTWCLYEQWSEETLLEKYADIVFRAEGVDWTLGKYLTYMNNNNDESPLYLFDRAFVEKMSLVVSQEGDYQPPECFREDLFTVLGEDRPDHRWLIIGPERSGSTFHKDPNATSAWNAVIRGSKYWIMFPNSVLPPGVYMSADQSEVTSPLSIAEWLLTFHDDARNTPGCFEGICGEGEVLHVPSGWWHLVVNLEPAIAITQNFVPRDHLNAAVNFLKHKADQVSGFRNTVVDPHVLFVKRIQERFPDLIGGLEGSGARKRKWEEVVADSDKDATTAGGFSFGFANDDDIDDAVDYNTDV